LGDKGVEMKMGISLAALFAVYLMGCGKEPIPEYRIVYYPNKKNVKEEWSIIRTPRGDTLQHGVHKQYFWNGTPAQSEVWKQGKRQGSAQAWYESGEVKWQKNYVDNKPDGTWRLNRKGGQPWEVINFDKGLIDGTVQIWDKADAGMVKEAVFAKGNCVSGECGLMDFPAISSDTGAVAIEMARDREIVEAFRN
jgi:hypothetical protein